MAILIRWVIVAAAVLVTSKFINGFRVDSTLAALIAALLLGFANTFVRPVLVLLTLPVSVLTLGLFLLVLNAFLLYAVSWIVHGFWIDTFWAALVGSILISIVSAVLNSLFKK